MPVVNGLVDREGVLYTLYVNAIIDPSEGYPLRHESIDRLSAMRCVLTAQLSKTSEHRETPLQFDITPGPRYSRYITNGPSMSIGSFVPWCSIFTSASRK